MRQILQSGRCVGLPRARRRSIGQDSGVGHGHLTFRFGVKEHDGAVRFRSLAPAYSFGKTVADLPSLGLQWSIPQADRMNIFPPSIW